MAQHGTHVHVGFGWVQHEPGQWRRWLMRICTCCQALDVTELIWVDAAYDMCPSCLSQFVRSLDQDPETNECLECGMYSRAGSTLEDADFC